MALAMAHSLHSLYNIPTGAVKPLPSIGAQCLSQAAPESFHSRCRTLPTGPLNPRCGLEQSDRVNIHQLHRQWLKYQNGDRNLAVNEPVAVGHEELKTTPVIPEKGIGENEEDVPGLRHAFHHILGNILARDEVSLMDAQRQVASIF